MSRTQRRPRRALIVTALAVGLLLGAAPAQAVAAPPAVSAAPVFDTAAALPDATVGVAYRTRLELTTGATVRFRLLSGTLPTGLTLDPRTGVISGTPSAAATATLRVRAETSGGSVERAFTLRVGTAPVIDPADLPDAIRDQPYTATLTATGDTPLTWSVTDLPDGLHLDSATGVISGTPQTAGMVQLGVQVSNDFGVDERTAPLRVGTAPTISTDTLPDAVVGRAYSARVASSGSGPITLGITEGALPDGLSLDPATGAITGTPRVAGPFAVAITATSWAGVDARTFTGATWDAPAIGATALPDAVVGVGYVADPGLTGTGPLTLAITQGALPEGLLLDPATGVISGIPSAEQDVSFTLTAESWAGRTSRSFILRAWVAPTLVTEVLPSAVLGADYRGTITAAGSGPMEFAVSAGALPAGLHLDPASGVLSGTPTESGTFTVAITVVSWAGSYTAEYPLRVWVAPRIVAADLPGGVIGTEYAGGLALTGDGPLNIAITAGSLPPGLTLDPASGVITGVPTTEGFYPISVTVTGPGGVALRGFNLAVLATPDLVTAELPDAIVDAEYRAVVQAAGTAPFSFAITDGALPEGLTLDPETGVLSGTPATAGEYPVEISATGAGGTVSREFTTRVQTPPLLDPDAVPAARVGEPYTATITATGDGEPVFAIAGELPEGLTLDPDTGVLIGTPTDAGDFPLRITVTSAYGKDQREATLTVTAPEVLNATPTPSLARTGASVLGGALAAAALVLVGLRLYRGRLGIR